MKAIADMSKAEMATALMTITHIERVREILLSVSRDFQDRAVHHDSTKLDDPQLSVFTEYTPKLAELTFDSPEYKACLAEMKVALDNHYALERHHPEHFENGIDDMDLVDAFEMLADCKAASERQNNGNILLSLDKLASRHNISPQLLRMLKNTAIRRLERQA